MLSRRRIDCRAGALSRDSDAREHARAAGTHYSAAFTARELYPEVVDDPENEGGVPSRLIKTDSAPRGGERKARQWRMFARSRSRSPARRSRSRSMTSLVREPGG